MLWLPHFRIIFNEFTVLKFSRFDLKPLKEFADVLKIILRIGIDITKNELTTEIKSELGDFIKYLKQTCAYERDMDEYDKIFDML